MSSDPLPGWLQQESEGVNASAGNDRRSERLFCGTPLARRHRRSSRPFAWTEKVHERTHPETAYVQ